MLRGPFTCLQHMWLTRHEARREERRSRTAVDPAFAEGLERTVAWYVANRTWWERVRSGEYRSYYERNYGARR